MCTEQIALELLTFCKKQQFAEARTALYATDAISIEANNQVYNGIDAITEKGVQWSNSVERVDKLTISEPLVIGQFFSVAFTWHITYKNQPATIWQELGVFEVKGGKVVLEKFYY
jgi:hypothetical protein